MQVLIIVYIISKYNYFNMFFLLNRALEYKNARCKKRMSLAKHNRAAEVAE